MHAGIPRRPRAAGRARQRPAAALVELADRQGEADRLAARHPFGARRLLSGQPEDRRGRAVDVRLRRRPVGHGNPQVAAAAPGGAAEPAGAVVLDLPDDRVGARVGTEGSQDLVEDDVVGDLGAAFGEGFARSGAPAGSSGRPVRRRRRGPVRAAPPRPRSRGRGATTPASGRPCRTPRRRRSGRRRGRRSPRRGRPGARRRRTPSRRGRSATCARRRPRSRPARRRRAAAPVTGLAAAQRPKAPSTWIQASFATARAARRSSQAPVFTFPACRQTIVGPSPVFRARSSMSIAPCGPASTGSTARVPKPSSRRARSTVACRSSLATTRTRGAPPSPSRSTSQPASASTWWRAAASPTVFAACPPVTKPAEAVAGRPSRSFSHAPAASSAAAAAGESTALKPFWSQPVARTSAAVAAGSAPPTTKPKNRGPAVATRPGSATRASSSRTASGAVGSFGSGPPKASRRAAGSTARATGRPARLSRWSAASSAARARRSRRSSTALTLGPK